MLLHNADPTMINIRNETARDLADVSGRKIISMAITEATGMSRHVMIVNAIIVIVILHAITIVIIVIDIAIVVIVIIIVIVIVMIVFIVVLIITIIIIFVTILDY